MKKQILSLIAISCFVASSSAAYQSNPDLFKKVVEAMGATPSGTMIRNNVVGAYKQMLAVMMNTRALCKQRRGDMATIKADFVTPARAFLGNMASRISKFKAMNADALLTPMYGILSEMVTSDKDFEMMLDWAIREMQMHMAAVS